MSGVLSWSSGLLQWVTSSLFSVAHTAHLLSLGRTTHSCCCSWWAFYGTDISKMLRFSVARDLHFPQQPVIVLLHGAELQLLCTTSSILLLSQRLHLHQWPLLEPQLLSMSPHAFETSTTWAVPALLSSTASKFHGLAHIWNTAPFCSPKTFPRFHLNDTSLFLITTNFLSYSQPASSILTE